MVYSIYISRLSSDFKTFNDTKETFMYINTTITLYLIAYVKFVNMQTMKILHNYTYHNKII